jgi:hypothetical protein
MENPRTRSGSKQRRVTNVFNPVFIRPLQFRMLVVE